MTRPLPDLDELERLRAEATPGPYKVVERGCTVCGYDVKPLEVGMRGMFDRPEDARYIALLLTIAPQLIAACRERDELREVAAEVLRTLDAQGVVDESLEELRLALATPKEAK